MAKRMLSVAALQASFGNDMAANIVHLVLARLPDAPAGSKGISLFAVPKWNVKADGSLGERNAIWCGGLEHKMGIHGNATAQIVLDGAVGSLVGQPNKGLQAMFVMMNAARLGVGMQSLGLTEVAYQNAAVYAKERLQMRSLSGPKAPDKPADPIIVHPDVRKMLLTARAYAEGGRALAMFTTLLLDRELASADDDEKKECADLVALLTPIVKAFFTDNAWIATRTMLFSGCCAVSVEPPVWAWKRSACAFGFVTSNRSCMMRAHKRRAARNFATSWKKWLCALKKNESRSPNSSGESPASTAACA